MHLYEIRKAIKAIPDPDHKLKELEASIDLAIQKCESRCNELKVDYQIVVTQLAMFNIKAEEQGICLALGKEPVLGRLPAREKY